MSPEEVLAQLEAERAEIAEVITLLETRQGELSAVGAAAAARLDQLKTAFDDFQSHLRAEQSRTHDAIQDLMEDIKASRDSLVAEATTRLSETRTFISAADAQADAFDEVTTTLGNLADRIAEDEAAGSAMLSHVETQTGALQGSFEAVIHDTLKPAAVGLIDRLHADGAAGRAQLEALFGNVLRSARERAAAGLGGASAQAAAALAEHGRSLDEHARQTLSQALSREAEARQALAPATTAADRALEEFAHLSRTSAQTLIGGATDASSLMRATNLGAGSVIGVIENVQAIMREIEDAWA